MFNIDNLEIYIDNTDISALVTSMSLYESIHGNIKGTIHVEDKLNFFDLFFRGLALTSVRIIYSYFDVPIEIILYVDGVTDQVINKQGKSYNVNLVSINNMNEATARICNSYSGTSNDILTALWKETHGEKIILVLDSETSSKGKYIVPNISARDAIRTVVNTAHDKNNTPMFLYQRLIDQGMTRFTSIDTMQNNKFLSAHYDNFQIHSDEMTLDNTTGVSSTIGSTMSFAMPDYNKNFIGKLSGGMWGQKITEVNVSETTNKVLPPMETTDVEITKMKLSKNLYSNIEKADGPAGQITSYPQKSLFDPESLVSEEIIRNMKYRLFNTTLDASNVVAIPGVGCGMIINVAQGGGQVSITKTDGTYLIANINHRYIMDDGIMQYSQNIGLVREGLE